MFDESKFKLDNLCKRGHDLDRSVALSIYLNNGKAKVELAICRGKQLHDKRNAIRQKDLEREIKKEF